eukprot:gene5526-9343_t
MSMPIDCSMSARLLEENEEEFTVLSGDPCEDGRVCEHKCSCGKKVLFRVDNLMRTNTDFKTVFKKVCIQNKYEVYQTTSGRKGKKKTITTGGLDKGFMYSQLQKALRTVGKSKHYRRINRGFGYLYHSIMAPVELKKTRNPRKGVNRRIDYAAVYLAGLALQLRDFLHVCAKNPDWKIKVNKRVNSIFNNYNRKNYNKYVEKSAKPKGSAIKAAKSMKTEVMKYLRKENKSTMKYCSCSKLRGSHRVSYIRKTRRKGGYDRTVSYKFVNFTSYIKKIDRTCKKKCHK